MLSPIRDATSARRFLRKALRAKQTTPPRLINVDRNPSYPKAMSKLKKKGTLKALCELRSITYLNSLIEQDHKLASRLQGRSICRVCAGTRQWHVLSPWCE